MPVLWSEAHTSWARAFNAWVLLRLPRDLRVLVLEAKAEDAVTRRKAA